MDSKSCGIRTSIFVNPDPKMIRGAYEIGADRIELYTYQYAHQFKIDKEAYGKNPCTKEELREFFQDGCDILDFFRKKRGQYFSRRSYKLIGCEVPIEVMLEKDIKMVGYLDIVILDEITDIDIDELILERKEKIGSYGKFEV